MLSLPGFSQSLKPVSGSYAIENARVVQGPGRIIEGANVIIRDGLITAVGKGVAIPVDAQRVKGDSLVVYAGFIDGLSHAGLEEPKRGERPNVKDPGNPPNDIAGITPYTDVRELLNASDKSVEQLRNIGFTVSHTVPYGNMLPGKGAIILLGGNDESSMVLKENASLFSQLEGARGVYPNTLIGVMAKYRELYTQAKLAKNDLSTYASVGAGMNRPATNRVLESFFPVIDGRMPVVFRAESILDVHRVLMLRDELGFNLILAGVKQTWDIRDLIKSRNLPLFVSLDMPEWKEEKKDSTLTGDEAKEYEALFNRKQDILKQYYSQTAALSNASIPYGFSTLGLKTGEFHKNLLKMKEQGATEDQLLAALTTSPASLLGLSKTMGTVDVGKMANLVVTDKNYFEKDAAVRYVFVEGAKYEMEAKSKAKEKKGSEAVDPVGSWSFTADPQTGDVATGTITISGAPGDYKGSMRYDQGGSSFDLSDVTYEGNILTFTVVITDGGQQLAFDGSLTMMQDSFEGTVTSSQLGAFPITGERKPE
jgi:hypothetical protein